ncbi:MAG: hypothetical protein AB7I04_21925 [Pseudomonadales bacterium]
MPTPRAATIRPPRLSRRDLGLALILLAASACTSKPIVDMKGVNRAQYDQDLAECSQYQGEVPVGQKAVGAAVAGAAVGAAVGVIWDGHDGHTVARDAGTGAVLGGAGGAASGVSEKSQVVKNCLRGRGYQVLN